MSLLLAPYNHAMRLGQGFNSYTQQICIDDAVVIDEQRPENIVTNDGTTMRIMAQKNAQPSAWTRQKEVIVGQPATAVLVENARKAKEEVEMIEAELADEAAEKELEEEESKKDGKEPESDPERGPEIGKGGQEVADAGDSGEEESADDSESMDDGTDTDDEDSRNKPTSVPQAFVVKPPIASGKPTKVDNKGIPGKAPPMGPSPDPKVTKPIVLKPIPSRPGGKTDGSKGEEKSQGKPGLANIDTKPKQPSGEKMPTSTSGTAKLPSSTTTKPRLPPKPIADPTKAAKEEAAEAKRQAEEAELLAEHRRDQKALQLEQRRDEMERRAEDREEQRAIRAEKRAWDAKRREDARKAIQNAADLKATSLQDLEKIRAQNQFVERFSGIAEQTGKFDFDPTAPRGPSQNVTYTSRFVDRLSDVTEDLCVSASLSIKSGRVGGSGKGSFVDSDKFKESDLNFYISVKVVNQTINFKDPLVYNPLPSVDENNFREVYGDSFISGFVEGGEFNAIVSMKILNKAKKSDIQAEAKVAFTVGPVDVSGEANLGIARSNIQTNTETTIQVNWSGGGHIKPMEQQWDIHSLMEAASRFPDLVADCPQRTYAILTKYDSLRSFVAKKPGAYTPLQYENAQIYTSTLLDAFVSYKSLYKRLGEQIDGVRSKLLEITPWSDEERKNVRTSTMAVSRMGTKDPVSGLYPHTDVTKYFEDSVTGLSDARTAVRRQMARIVNEVDLMEKDPKKATDEDHLEPYQSPIAFEARLPVVDTPARLRVRNPLSGKRLTTKTLTEEEQKAILAEEAKLGEGGPLYTSGINDDEQKSFDAILGDNPSLNASFRASGAVGDNTAGKLFNNLDFLKPDWVIKSIRVEMADGALAYLAISYENGLVVEKGVSSGHSRVKKFGPFVAGERINSASVEHGRRTGADTPKQVLGLRLFTNRGRSLIARALKSEMRRENDKDIFIRDGVTYEDIKVQFMDMPFNSGTVKGFFGRSEEGTYGIIYRLGIIWCRVDELKPNESESTYTSAGDMVDLDDLAESQKIGNEALFAKLNSSEYELGKSRAQNLAAENQLEKIRQDLVDRDNKIAELERLRKPVWEAQSGAFKAADKGWKPGLNSNAQCAVSFPRSYPSPPKLLFGLSAVDCESNKPRSVSLSSAEIRPDGFTVHAASWNDTLGYRIDCNWMTLPDDLHLETGMMFTGVGDQTSWKQDIFFSQSFSSPPNIAVWIQEVEWTSLGYLTIDTWADNITPHKFTINVRSAPDRKFRSVRVQYLAFPLEEDGKRIKTGKTSARRAQRTISNTAPFYGLPFSKIPATFIAISAMEFNSTRNLRFQCEASAPNNRELTWSCGTWSDTEMERADVQWIAIE